MALTRPGGALFLALYNDQGWLSRYWTVVKRLYNRVPWLRGPLVALSAPYFVGLRWLVRLLSGRRGQERGMALWYDLIDWLGGWRLSAVDRAATNSSCGKMSVRVEGPLGER